MPCDSIILNRVELKLADKDFLKKALERLGVQNLRESGNTFTFQHDGNQYTLGGGKLTGRNVYGGDRAVGKFADKIKQAYSRVTVETAANRYGWLTQDSDDPNKFTAIKR